MLYFCSTALTLLLNQIHAYADSARCPRKFVRRKRAKKFSVQRLPLVLGVETSIVEFLNSILMQHRWETVCIEFPKEIFQCNNAIEVIIEIVMIDSCQMNNAVVVRFPAVAAAPST